MKYFEKTSEAVKVEVKQRSTSSNKGTTYSSKNKQSSKSFRSKSDKKSYSEKGGKSGSMHIFQ
ncbi:MAG: hypothetical protein H8D23_08415, partial [Candidatus Brocadiales bacterium]|nr:hypothetical protein [Candidatus Brocadiales bacterium]